MSFQDILGNSRVKTILSKSLENNRLPHSLLFVGPEGVGKEEAALVVAKTLNCLKRNDDACEECSSCEAINKKKFPDVMVLSPEKDVIKIDQMRLLKSTAYLKPMIGKRRVFIVSEAEKMYDEASNSLLKILEEPPSFSHILLLTSKLDLILPTIQSRCQTLSFAPVFREDIEKVLIERGHDREKARVLSLLVRGNLKYALSLDWEEMQEKREKAWQLFLALTGKTKAADFFKEFGASRLLTREAFEDTLEILSSFCRDALLLIEGGERDNLLNPDYTRELLNISEFLPVDRALDFLSKIDYSLYALQRHLNMKLLLNFLFSHFMEKSYV